MYGVTCRVTKKLDRFERRAVERLLAEAGLVFEGAPDCTALAEDCDENIIATASLEGYVIKMVAASSEWREAGLSGQVISALMSAARAEGRYKFFIYTKPEAAPKFSALGFRELAASKNSVLMECGAPGVNEYRANTRSSVEERPAGRGRRHELQPVHARTSIPHRRGRETVPGILRNRRRGGRLGLPFADRLALVREGDGAHPNVRVIASGCYAVSKATFPTYFLKDRGEMPSPPSRRELDARLFGRLFVPALGVTRRFVGTEPFCAVTALYNETLKKFFRNTAAKSWKSQERKAEARRSRPRASAR